MNNEIKVIIDQHWNYIIIGNEKYYDLPKRLLDYITNLQEENERLKEEYINVKNYIKMRNVSSEVEDKALLYNIELENINKKKYLDYKSRCEKAIKILESNYQDCCIVHKILKNEELTPDEEDTLDIILKENDK